MRDGRISYERFCVEAELLQKRSHELASRQAVGIDKCVATWEWRHGRRQHLDGDSYLVSTGNVLQDLSVENVDGIASFGELGGNNIDELLLSDETTVLQYEDVKTSQLEFHIVYHTIYQTPVLYFRALAVDGTPLKFDVVSHRVRLPGSNGLLQLVAIEEHPILGEPFSFLHPCETAAAMQLLQAELQCEIRCCTKALLDLDVPFYLASWLSLVQPLTDISPKDYYYL